MFPKRSGDARPQTYSDARKSRVEGRFRFNAATFRPRSRNVATRSTSTSPRSALVGCAIRGARGEISGARSPAAKSEERPDRHSTSTLRPAEASSPRKGGPSQSEAKTPASASTSPLATTPIPTARVDAESRRCFSGARQRSRQTGGQASRAAQIRPARGRRAGVARQRLFK